MRLKVLSSSSKGNCYLLITPTGTLILECGVSFKEIQKGLNFNLNEVVGCLITHEHKDHCKAVVDVMKAGIDCYMSRGTFEALDIPYPLSYRAISASIGAQIDFGDFIILSFDTEHDAADPRGFLIQYRPTGEKLLFITDTYYSKYTFANLNYILIECNYIKDTLDANIAAGYVDERMKPRLLKSHFSLEHVKEFLMANDLTQCREIILLHLSDSNSDAARMVKEIKDVSGVTPKVAEPGLEVELELYPY